VARAIDVGRDAFRRRAWREAYAKLSAAEREDDLAVDDLEQMATAAYLIGEHTVACHVHDLLAKLGASSRFAASSFAHEHHLL
jgi:hypothetical protein